MMWKSELLISDEYVFYKSYQIDRYIRILQLRLQGLLLQSDSLRLVAKGYDTRRN